MDFFKFKFIFGTVSPPFIRNTHIPNVVFIEQLVQSLCAAIKCGVPYLIVWCDAPLP